MLLCCLQIAYAGKHSNDADIGVLIRSYLQKVADRWMYTAFLDQAAQTTDRLMRLKLVLAWFVAGMRHGFSWEKPFNPVFGETWIGLSAAGLKVECKQVGVHRTLAQQQLQSGLCDCVQCTRAGFLQCVDPVSSHVFPRQGVARRSAITLL
jgi:Oxysterol-binding protein